MRNTVLVMLNQIYNRDNRNVNMNDKRNILNWPVLNITYTIFAVWTVEKFFVACRRKAIHIGIIIRCSIRIIAFRIKLLLLPLLILLSSENNKLDTDEDADTNKIKLH